MTMLTPGNLSIRCCSTPCRGVQFLNLEHIGLPPEEWRGEIRALRGKPGDPFHGHPCLDRCSIVESGMKTLPILDRLDITEPRRFRLFAGAEAAVVDVLDLKRGKHALHRCIVQAVPAAAHRLNDAVPLQHRPIRLSGVLGGFKWSSQHPPGGSCDVGSEAPFGSIRTAAIVLTRPPTDSGTR